MLQFLWLGPGGTRPSSAQHTLQAAVHQVLVWKIQSWVAMGVYWGATSLQAVEMQSFKELSHQAPKDPLLSWHWAAWKNPTDLYAIRVSTLLRDVSDKSPLIPSLLLNPSELVIFFAIHYFRSKEEYRISGRIFFESLQAPASLRQNSSKSKGKVTK